jgi:hypothetical protein
MQSDDHAFVVARVHLPSECSDRAAVAAAWPPDTLGFGNLDPLGPAQQQPDLLLHPQSTPLARPSFKMSSYSSRLYSRSYRDANALTRGSFSPGSVGGSTAGADTGPALGIVSAPLYSRGESPGEAPDCQQGQGLKPDVGCMQGGRGGGRCC